MIASVIAGFLAGLASAPHCAGMCGPLCAAACAGRPRAPSLGGYLGARLVTYSLLGAIAGTAGRSLADRFGDRAALVLAIAMAAGLVIAAVRVWPRNTDAPRLVSLGRKRVDRRAPAWAPIALGLATGFLPCGALFGALLLAAGAGTAEGGVATMLAFGATTSVALFAMGYLAERMAREGGRAGRRIVAGLLVVGALVTLLRPIAMGGGDGSCPAHEGHAMTARTLPNVEGGAS